MQTVTSQNWSASCTTGGLIHGAILNVRRYPQGTSGKSQKGDLDGKVFKNSDEAFAVALERGYTQRYVQAWCPNCRCLHRGRPYDVAENKKLGVKARTVTPRRGYIDSVSKLAHWKLECVANSKRAAAKQYTSLTAQLKRLLATGTHEAVAQVWQQIENIKNKYGGKVPAV